MTRLSIPVVGRRRFSVSGGLVLDSSIAPPVLSLAVPANTYPPQANLRLSVDVKAGVHSIEFVADDDIAFGSPFLGNTLAISDAEAAAKTKLDSNLSSIVSGISYFRARMLWTSSSINYCSNWSNTIGHGDVTAPTISTSASQSVVETLPLTVTLSANKAIASWTIEGGADQLQHAISSSTLEWAGNGSQSYAVPNDQGQDNIYDVVVGATDYFGNKTTKTISTTVTAADLTPNTFTWTNDSNTPVSTVYTAANTWTVAGLSTGVNAPLSVTGGLYSKNGGAYTSVSATVQNGDTIQARGTSSSSYSTSVNVVVTVGTLTATYTIGTAADPNAASFVASSVQPASIDHGYSSATYTFTGVDFIVGGHGVVFACLSNDARTISSVTIVGAGASGADIALVQRVVQSSGLPMSVWAAPTGTVIVNGTNRSIVMVLSATASFGGILCGTLINASSSIPSATAITNFASNASPVTMSALTIPSQGVGVAFWEMNSQPPFVAGTGTLLTTGMNANNGGVVDCGAITRQITAGSWTPTITYASTQANDGGLACVWSH